MGKRLRLSYPSVCVSVEVELDWQSAPRTCEALWASLPQVGTAHHAVYSGSEGVLVLPQIVRVDPENATHIVRKGDVGYTWFAAGSAYGVDRDFSEICWFYGDDACPSMHGGPVPVSIFGRMVGDIDAFCAISRQLRRIGVRGMLAERACDAEQRSDAVVFRPDHGSAFHPLAAVLPDGSVACLFHWSPAEPAHGPRTTACLVFSKDQGRSWTRPVWVSGRELPGLRCSSLVAAGDRILISGRLSEGARVRWEFANERWDEVLVDSCSDVQESEESRQIAEWVSGKLGLGDSAVRPVHAAGANPISLRFSDGSQLFLFSLWDNAPEADVPGVCGIHASRIA